MSVKAKTPRIVLAAPKSGAGKTTVSMGLAAAISAKLKVAPFKIGPDYIDPGYLSAAAGSPAVNLDSWLQDKATLRRTFYQHSASSDLALIEGAMGLFDGRGPESDGSTAQVCEWLKAPIVLVVDSGGAGQTLAASVLGFKTFSSNVDVAGIFLNRVGSDSHLKTVTDAIEKRVGVPVIGHLKVDDGFAAPARHLGLAQMDPNDLAELAARLGRETANNTDMAMLLEVAGAAGPLSVPRDTRVLDTGLSPRIGVARDAAFSFYYQDTFLLLERLGARLTFFSPLTDKELPAGLDGLYFGGGWPELYAAKLAGNSNMRSAVRAAAAGGLPIYAECGGLIYLSDRLEDSGSAWPMAGVLPVRTKMTKRRQSLGYRRAKFNCATILGERGFDVRGHEFHWSMVDREIDRGVGRPAGEGLDSSQSCLTMEPKAGGFEYAYLHDNGRLEGYASPNVLASYLHLSWTAQPELAANFIHSCGGGRDA